MKVRVVLVVVDVGEGGDGIFVVVVVVEKNGVCYFISRFVSFFVIFY